MDKARDVESLNLYNYYDVISPLRFLWLLEQHQHPGL